MAWPRTLLAFQLLTVAAMFVGAMLVYPAAPASIPVHWSLSGQPNGYADKLWGLMLLPIITLLVIGGLRLLPRLDPARDRYAEFASAYAVAGTAIVVFLAAVQGLILAWALGSTVNVELVIVPLVGLLLIVLGAVMAEIQPNWFFGIRTPWTLSSDRSWRATHRAGRWVLMLMGLGLILAGLVQAQWALQVAIGVCVIGVVGLVAYSYVIWRAEPR